MLVFLMHCKKKKKKKKKKKAVVCLHAHFYKEKEEIIKIKG
jgi:hypothetical protein